MSERTITFMLGPENGVTIISVNKNCFYSFERKRLDHHIILSEPTYTFSGIRGSFKVLFHFFHKILLNKWNSLRWDTAFKVFYVSKLKRKRDLSHHMRKRTICIGKNKAADQLCSYCTADQCLCFHCTDSKILLLLKYEISSL